MHPPSHAKINWNQKKKANGGYLVLNKALVGVGVEELVTLLLVH